MKNILFIFCLLFIQNVFAGTVDTVSIYSNSMNRNINTVVIKPDSYKKKKNTYPTVYLLHGHGGSFNNWVTRVPDLKKYADKYQLIIVCPDGAFNSWYFDSPVDNSKNYETFVAKEVPAFVEKNYRTIKDRKARAITGLSMGGHGGLFLGFRHAGFFGACGSMSGALVIEYISDPRYGVDKLLGDTANKQLYRDYSIMNQMEKYPKDSIAVIMDCGTEDFIIQMSRMAHQKMLSLKIPHDYIERPGKHDWDYWRNAVEYQLLYFKNFFEKK